MLAKTTWAVTQLTTVALLLAARTLPTPQVPHAEPLRISVSLVTVGIRVMDAKGREVPNLRASDFTIFEDGVTQEIAFFSAEEQPISLGILLDRSDSMEAADKLERAKTAAQLLVDASHRASEYLFIPFDAQCTPVEFTEDREKLTREITATRLGKGTSLYDAVILALERCKRAKHGRQALVVITDGADQHSSHKLDDLIRAVQESQVQLYTIAYFSSREEELFRQSGPTVSLTTTKLMDNPRTVFRRLARESGADTYFPRSDKELQSAVEKISLDLRTQYTIAYYPANPVPDNRYRGIKVKLGPKGLKVRARQGYVLPSASLRVR